VGLPNGRVVLTKFAPDAIGRNAVVQECVPQYTRTCNDVAWNPALPSFLAVGFDKSSRSQDGVYVWDLEYDSVARVYYVNLLLRWFLQLYRILLLCICSFVCIVCVSHLDRTAPSHAPHSSYPSDTLNAKEVRMASLSYDNSNDYANTITQHR
jgi:hypothetical protein